MPTPTNVTAIAVSNITPFDPKNVVVPNLLPESLVVVGPSPSVVPIDYTDAYGKKFMAWNCLETPKYELGEASKIH